MDSNPHRSEFLAPSSWFTDRCKPLHPPWYLKLKYSPLPSFIYSNALVTMSKFRPNSFRKKSFHMLTLNKFKLSIWNDFFQSEWIWMKFGHGPLYKYIPWKGANEFQFVWNWLHLFLNHKLYQALLAWCSLTGLSIAQQVWNRDHSP